MNVGPDSRQGRKRSAIRGSRIGNERPSSERGGLVRDIREHLSANAAAPGGAGQPHANLQAPRCNLLQARDS